MSQGFKKLVQVIVINKQITGLEQFSPKQSHRHSDRFFIVTPIFIRIVIQINIGVTIKNMSECS